MPVSEKKARYFLVISSLLVCFFSLSTSHAYNNTPRFWKCNNKVGGNWQFGYAPDGCDVSAFINATQAKNRYAPVIHNDTAPSASRERSRYMNEMLPFFRDVALHYLKIRKPNASNTERLAWLRLVYTTAHQESFWSHYRMAKDGRLKMMRGDFGHGHGYMQVDDRWHFAANQKGKGANLVENITYSLDQIYRAWQKAPSLSCVSSASNWKSRTRATYSMYNGGPSKGCRWTRPNDRWARNDRGFLEKWNKQAWKNYVSDLGRPSKLDVACLISGNNNCSSNATNNGNISSPDTKGALIKVASGQACVLRKDTLYCIDSDKHSTCLAGISDFDPSKVINKTASEFDQLKSKEFESHEVCHSTVPGLHTVTSAFTLKKANVLRTTPGGGKITDIPADTQLQVLDFSVMNNERLQRFYKVKYNDKVGYVWGGDKKDYTSWSERTEAKSQLEIAGHGQWIQINNNTGIHLRTAPASSAHILTKIPKGQRVQVKDVLVRDNSNKIYYNVEFKGVDGYIYGGFNANGSTVDQWVSIIAEPSGSSTKAAYCPEGAWYDNTVNTCVDEEHAYGPFPMALTKRCEKYVKDNSSSCTDTYNVIIGETNQPLQRWSRHFHSNLYRNTYDFSSVCAYGTAPSAKFGFHCVEKEKNKIKNVFGPFGSAMVASCKAIGGGNACYLNRWSPSVYSAVINRSELGININDINPTPVTQPQPPQQQPPQQQVSGDKFPYYNQNFNKNEGWRACNITSIAMALDHYDITSRAKLGQRTPDYLHSRYGIEKSVSGLKNIFNKEASRVGSKIRNRTTLSGTPAALQARARAGKPTVVHGDFTRAGHIVQVIGFDGSHYIVHDPNGKWSERYKGGYVSTRTGGNAVRYSKKAFETAVNRGGIWMHRFD